MRAHFPFLATLPPTTVRVHCNGQLYQISVRKGVITLHNHTKTSLQLQSVLQTPARCEDIYKAVMSGDDNRLPSTLKRALTATTRIFARHRDTELRLPTTTPPWSARGRHGWFTPYAITVRHLTFANDPITVINIASIRPYKNAAPIRFEGNPDAMTALFDKILVALRKGRRQHRV